MLIRERLCRNQIFLFEPNTLTLRIYRTGGSGLIKSLRNPLTGNDGVNFQLECVIQLHYILLEVGDSHGRKRSCTNTY